MQPPSLTPLPPPIRHGAAHPSERPILIIQHNIIRLFTYNTLNRLLEDENPSVPILRGKTDEEALAEAMEFPEVKAVWPKLEAALEFMTSRTSGEEKIERLKDTLIEARLAEFSVTLMRQTDIFLNGTPPNHQRAQPRILLKPGETLSDHSPAEVELLIDSVQKVRRDVIDHLRQTEKFDRNKALELARGVKGEQRDLDARLIYRTRNNFLSLEAQEWVGDGLHLLAAASTCTRYLEYLKKAEWYWHRMSELEQIDVSQKTPETQAELQALIESFDPLIFGYLFERSLEMLKIAGASHDSQGYSLQQKSSSYRKTLERDIGFSLGQGGVLSRRQKKLYATSRLAVALRGCRQ